MAFHQIDDAEAIQLIVKEVHPTLCNHDMPSDNEDQCAVALYSLLQHLQLLKDSPLDDVDLRVYLSNLRSKVSDGAVAQMLLYLEGSEALTDGAKTEEVNNVAVIDLD